MPLSLRQRGEIWHARGSVRVGRNKVIPVKEFSTGCRARRDAEIVAARTEREIYAAETEGPAGQAKRTEINALILAYLQRPGGVPDYDKARLAEFATLVGSHSVADTLAAWQAWLTARGKGMAASSAARWRSIFQAALSYGAAQHGLSAPKLPTLRVPDHEKAVWLSHEEQERLLAAYSPNARPVALVLCYQGLRSAEAIRLEWRHVNFKRRTLFVAKSKTGKQRTVPLHWRVLARLRYMWAAQGKPTSGKVFISQRGEPYTETNGQGGNPITKAHATACRKAGITGFSPHSWRHHWASWQVMNGTNLPTLMRLGGWASPRMVQHYASVSVDHMAEAIGRMK